MRRPSLASLAAAVSLLGVCFGACYDTHGRGLDPERDDAGRDAPVDAWMADAPSGAIDGGRALQPVWTELEPPGEGPSARHGAFGVYDPTRDALWVLGGRACWVACPEQAPRDVWRLDLATETWTRAFELPAPIAACGDAFTELRSVPVALFDAERDRIVVPSGCAPTSTTREALVAGTLDLTTGTWTDLAPPRRSARYAPEVTDGRAVGMSELGVQVLELATLTVSPLDVPGFAAGDQLVGAGDRRFVLGVARSVDPDRTTLGELDVAARRFTTRRGMLEPLFLGQAVWDPDHRRILAFGGALFEGGYGGTASGTVVIDPSIVDGASEWLSPSPRGRESAIFVWDARRGRALLFGGRAAPVGVRVYDDLWALELSTRP